MKNKYLVLLIVLLNVCCGKSNHTYLAEYALPCNKSVLKIHITKNDKPVMVDAIGENNPIKRLRYHALIQTKFIITGYFTGKLIKDSFSECSYFKEFYVTDFKPIGITRFISTADLDPDAHVYIANLPRDTFAPEDFIDGPALKYIDPGSYTKYRTNSKQVRITDFNNEAWYCNLK